MRNHGLFLTHSDERKESVGGDKGREDASRGLRRGNAICIRCICEEHDRYFVGRITDKAMQTVTANVLKIANQAMKSLVAGGVQFCDLPNERADWM